MISDAEEASSLRSHLLSAEPRVAHAILELYRQHGVLDEGCVK
jgi:hypothetical protein